MNSFKKVEEYQVSVVISVYKNINNFKLTLESIFKQVNCSYQVIVIDDGNCQSDATCLFELCKEYPNVFLYRNENNIGLTKSLIVGCEAATAPFIARIDSGDIMVPNNRLALQVAVLEEKDFVICGGGMDIVDVQTGGLYKTKSTGDNISYIDKLDLDFVKTCFPHVTVMFNREAYMKSGGYNSALKVGQDTDLWPRLLSFGKGVLFNCSFAVAPMWKDSISVAKNNEQIAGKIKRIKKLRSKHGKIFYFSSLFSIFIEYVKILIPSGLRNKIKMKKNYSFEGVVFKKNCSLSEIYRYYIED